MGKKVSSLQDFRDIHKGKMAFLVGCGVSIDPIEEEVLKPYITMVINQAILKITQPTYFFSCDGGIFNYDTVNSIPKEGTTEVILTDEILDILKEDNIRGKPIEHFYALKRKTNTTDIESITARNTDEELIFGLTSAHPAAHLLYVMGCDPIVLLGCECKYNSDGIYAFYFLPKYKHLLNPHYIDGAGNASLPLPGEHKKILIRNLPGWLSAFHQYWDHMHKLSPNMPIIDSCDSVMSSYRKMPLEDVLKEYGDRIK